MSLCDLGRHIARGSFALQAVLLNMELPTINPHDTRIMPGWKCAKMAELPPFCLEVTMFPLQSYPKTVRLIISLYYKTRTAFIYCFTYFIFPLALSPLDKYVSLSQDCIWDGFVFLRHDAASWDPLGLVSMVLWVNMGTDEQCHPRSLQCIVCIYGGVLAGKRWLVVAARSSCIQGNSMMRRCDLSAVGLIKDFRIIFLQVHIKCKQ